MIKLYCDSQSVLDRIQTTTGSPYPRDTIQDDYPIFKEIQLLLQTLQPIHVELLHVTGHQDEKCIKRPLTTPEILNIECDERATKLNNTLIETPVPHHPLFPSSYPHLQINKHTIIRQLQSNLREAATRPAYHRYLNKKYDWTDNQTDQIQWHTFRLAYNRLNKQERKLIAKFNHNWLPLQTSHHIQSTSEQQLCPSCRGHTETNDHFLQCTHID